MFCNVATIWLLCLTLAKVGFFEPTFAGRFIEQDGVSTNGVSETRDLADFGGVDQLHKAEGRGGSDFAAVGVTVAPPPGAPAEGLANPSLAMGLNGLADWSSQQPFIDVMKMARAWTGHTTDQWGAWSHDDLAAGGHLDENGWLKTVPSELRAVEALLLTDLPAEAVSLAGRYRVTYEGAGDFRLQGRVDDVSYGDGEIWFDFTPGPGAVALSISRTDPRGVGDYIRNIEVVKQENIALHEVGAVFNPDWIEVVEDLRAIRFMDWMSTNGSTVSDWEERPKVSDYAYTLKGAPLEVMVALADQIGADPWFTMPHLASEEYVREFAVYVRDHLDPRLKAYVEYSNEVWNWQFAQAQWAHQQGQARWGADVGDAWVQYYGMRAAWMAMIWDEVYGSAAEERLVKVISTQTGWFGLEASLLEAPRWVAEDPINRPPAEHFDAYGVTGYFSSKLGNEKAAVVLSWIAQSREAAVAEAGALGLGGAARDAYVEAHKYDQALARAARELLDGSVTGDREDSVMHFIDTILSYHAEVASRNGLDLIMYEGGTHVVGVGEWVDNADLTDFFIRLNYSPEMGVLYETLLQGWKNAGGGLFNAFVDVAAPSRWGSWGALRHLGDRTPRWDALDAFNRTNEAWWEERDPTTFVHGVTRFGADGDDTLTGAFKNDILLGGAGDDMLISGGGEDRLHGGEGEDAALLPGGRADYVFQRQGETLIAIGADGSSRLRSVERIVFANAPDAPLGTLELR